MFVSCVHLVAVLIAAFCMTCSLLMLVEDGRGDHMEEAYSRAGIMTIKQSKVRPKTCGCVAIGSAVMFILGPDCSYILQGLE